MIWEVVPSVLPVDLYLSKSVCGDDYLSKSVCGNESMCGDDEADSSTSLTVQPGRDELQGY